MAKLPFGIADQETPEDRLQHVFRIDLLKQLRAALERGPILSCVGAVAEESDTVDANYLGNFIIEMTV